MWSTKPGRGILSQPTKLRSQRDWTSPPIVALTTFEYKSCLEVKKWRDGILLQTLYTASDFQVIYECDVIFLIVKRWLFFSWTIGWTRHRIELDGNLYVGTSTWRAPTTWRRRSWHSAPNWHGGIQPVVLDASSGRNCKSVAFSFSIFKDPFLSFLFVFFFYLSVIKFTMGGARQRYRRFCRHRDGRQR